MSDLVPKQDRAPARVSWMEDVTVPIPDELDARYTYVVRRRWNATVVDGVLTDATADITLTRYSRERTEPVMIPHGREALTRVINALSLALLGTPEGT